MKRLIVILVVAFLSLSMAQEKQTLTVSTFCSLCNSTRVLAENYMAENPNVEIIVNELEFGDHHNNLVTALATGEGAPDVAAVEIGFIAKFVADGGFEDLSQAPYNAGEFEDQVADYAWSQGSTADGRLIAMPVDIAPGAMFYRHDRFEELGKTAEDVIGSWDDLVAFGKEVTRDLDGDGTNDVFLIADAADVFEGMIRMDLEEGQGKYFDSEGNVLVNTERFHEAFRVAKEIRDAGLDAQIGAWSNEWYQAFKDGAVAVQFSGAWLEGSLRDWMAPDTAGLWGASNLPGGAYATWGGSFFGIPVAADDANKDLAWDFIKYMTTNEEAQIEAFDAIEAFPSLKALWTDPRMEEESAFLNGQQARLLYVDVIDNIAGTITHPGDVIAAEIVSGALSQVLNEDRDIADALMEAERLIERQARRLN